MPARLSNDGLRAGYKNVNNPPKLRAVPATAGQCRALGEIRESSEFDNARDRVAQVGALDTVYTQPADHQMRH